MERKQTSKQYVVKHILNNSSIIVDGFLTERILMGKGIGFGLKPGAILPAGTVYDKSYQLLDKASDFHRIIQGYDENIVVMVMDTIEQIMQQHSGQFTTMDLVTLADHLAAMFLRLKNGEAIVSFFSFETKTIYHESFAKANDIAWIIQNEHQVQLPEAEIAYIALYLENINGHKSKREVELMSVILAQISDLFESQAPPFDKQSLAYSRFLIHIHLLVQSAQFRKKALNSAINKAILMTYHDYKTLAQQVLEIIKNETGYPLSDVELVYLVIHLVNLFEEKEDLSC